MTIYELSDMLDRNLIIERYVNQGRRHSAMLEGVEVKNSKDDRFITSLYGNGNTPQEAIDNYVKKIRGKLLVVNATKLSHRRELTVPASLTS